MTAPPSSIEELAARANALEGTTLGSIAALLDANIPAESRHAKGKLGALIERALGADPAPGKSHDFPSLGVELKTVPVDANGRARESTYVCTLPLTTAELEEWETSWVRRKLSCVLWVPIETATDSRWESRVVARPILWRPSPEQERILRDDFDDVMGLIGIGRVEELTAHLGRWLQVRPKARDGRARTDAWGPEGERLRAMPRGFYLRPAFTSALLSDPTATP